jgi:hypothetical protein
MVQEGNMSTTISNQNSESKSIESAHFFLATMSHAWLCREAVSISAATQIIRDN